jgi:hypothetical protein
MYVELTYQIHLGDSPLFVYLGVKLLASLFMTERTWINAHEVLSNHTLKRVGNRKKN